MLLEYHYWKKQICHRNALQIEPWTLGVTRGYAVFEYFRSHGMTIPCLNHYLQRFFRAAREMHLRVPVSSAELRETINRLFQLNRKYLSPGEDMGFRILLLGPSSQGGWLSPPESSGEIQGNLLILVEKASNPPSQWMKQGIRLKTLEFLRPYPHIKTTFYAGALARLPAIWREGYDDLLFVWEGKILETPRSNFFLIREDILWTPATRILPGITRNLVLACAREIGLPVREILNLPVSWLVDAQEAFITGSTKPVVPVIQVDHIRIGKGNPDEWKWVSWLREALLHKYREPISSRFSL